MGTGTNQSATKSWCWGMSQNWEQIKIYVYTLNALEWVHHSKSAFWSGHRSSNGCSSHELQDGCARVIPSFCQIGVFMILWWCLRRVPQFPETFSLSAFNMLKPKHLSALQLTWIQSQNRPNQCKSISYHPNEPWQTIYEQKPVVMFRSAWFFQKTFEP